MADERAREVLVEHMRFPISPEEQRMIPGIVSSVERANAIRADFILKALADADIQLIDTRTHVAVPREDDEALVDAVARVIATMFVPAYKDDAIWFEDLPLLRRRYEKHGLTLFPENPIGIARAALAAVRAFAAKEG